MSMFRTKRFISRVFNKIAASSSIIADLWQTFENATLSGSNLATTDHNGTGTWTVTDASSKLSVVSAGQQTMISTVNGITDTGTLGLAYSLSGGAVAYVDYAPTSAQTDMVVGFWYKTATPASFDAGPTAISFFNDAQGDMLRMIDRKDAGSNVRELGFISSTTVNMTTGIADATWYWISVRFTQNGTGQIAVFNTSGVQQGATTAITCFNFNITRVKFGQCGNVITTQSQTTYIDNIVMNWTAPTNTIGP